MVTKMTEDGIKQLARDAMDAACLEIQTKIGQTDGGVAGLFFSGKVLDGMIDTFRMYIRHELIFAKQKEQQERLADHGDYLYKVSLDSCGNPDFGQDPDRPLPGVSRSVVKVKSLEDASKCCRAYIDEHGIGGGAWAGGDVFELKTGKKVAHISYNGRIWNNDESEYQPPASEPPPVAGKKAPRKAAAPGM